MIDQLKGKIIQIFEETKEIITKETIDNKIVEMVEMIDMIAEIDKIITTKIKEIKKIIKEEEINGKEAEIKNEAGVMTNRVINMKSILLKTEITIEDNIEMNNHKNLGNLKFLLIVKMMITLITQMKTKDIINNLIQK